MEPAKIDWKRIDSRFVEDVFYEHIRAPKWFDFLDPELHDSIDDAWFCRPDCDHPKTAEDFLTIPPTASKFPSGGDADDILQSRDPKQSDAKLRRGLTASNTDYTENQNPNLATPPSHQAKSWRAALSSSSVKKTSTHDNLQNEEPPILKSTLTARNVFPGRDILGHISEFCYELKRLATRVTERESAGKPNTKETREGEMDEPYHGAELEAKKQIWPLLQVDKQKLDEVTDKGSSVKEKRRRKKRVDDAENIPVALNLENVKTKGDDRSLQIRTNPPSPQCFSANRAPTKAVSSKATRSKPSERGILQEVVERADKEQAEEKSRKSALSPSIVEAKEGRGLDVLWFLKPCTLAG